MPVDPITSLTSIKSELEGSWKLFDDVYAGFGPREWTRKLGRSWTFAEQPYHLAYFDGTLAKYLAYGRDVPEDDRMHLRSMGEIDEWNKREFARRAPSHGVEDSLSLMRQSRDAIRRYLQQMTEADLERTTWMPLVQGWGTARGVLHAVIIHNVAEYWKLWITTGKRTAAPSPAAVHLRLDFMMSMMPASMNRELAAKKPFTVVWNFEGPGGGAWTFNVRDGKCTVLATAVDPSDLTITMRPENFHKLVAKMAPGPLLILTRQMKIKGYTGMGTFARMFPEPKPAQVLSMGSG